MIFRFAIGIVTILLFCYPLSGQDNKIEDGYHIFKYPNGAVSSEGTIRDGKPDGEWKSYYITGGIKSEGRRRNFSLDSIWVFYTQKFIFFH